ncbi:MAG: rod shape-determining protein MreC [Nitrospirae bacterium]|nr:MAG: rod shape-determining protein MreC [Nitrospirota bacterium]
MGALLGRYRHALALAACLLAGVALLSGTRRDPDRFAWLQEAALSLVSPVERVVVGSGRAVRDAWRRHTHLARVAEEDVALRRRVAELEQRVHELEEVELENQRLARLLHLAPAHTDLPMVVARVIGRDASRWYGAIDLDRGVADGVHAGLAVITHQGVVGVVYRASGHACRVRLITDPASALPVLLDRQRVKCILQGTGHRCRLKYLETGVPVAEGEEVITSGYGHIFPKGLRVGRVVAVRRGANRLFQEVAVEPAVDLARLEEVFVFLQTPAAGP